MPKGNAESIRREASDEGVLGEGSEANSYEPLGAVRRAVEGVHRQTEQFGEALVNYLRVRTGASTEDHYPSSHRIRRGHDTRHPDYGEVLATGKHLVQALSAVASALNEVNLPEELAGRYQRHRLEAEVNRLGRAARDAARTIDRVLWVEDSEEWVAVGLIAHRPEAGTWIWELRRSPVSVGGALANVWDSLEAVVLTSATLRAGESFDYIIDSLGLGGVRTSVLDSPFARIDENHLLLLTDYLPAPRSRLIEEFKLSRGLRDTRLLILTGGRGLALMTARARLDFVRDHARPILGDAGIELLAQGDDWSAALVARMQDETATGLIALRSFWEGVDIPGEALSLLMIEKIPFDSRRIPSWAHAWRRSGSEARTPIPVTAKIRMPTIWCPERRCGSLRASAGSFALRPTAASRSCSTVACAGPSPTAMSCSKDFPARRAAPGPGGQRTPTAASPTIWMMFA